MKQFSAFLLSKRQGFSGVAHVEIAIGLLMLLFLIPVEPFTTYLKLVTNSPLIAVMAFLIIAGAALLPDLDNLKKDGGSSASWDLGFLGTILSSVMVTVSSVFTSLFHTKKDIRPNTQHRFFWHTLLIPIVLWACIYYLMPEGNVRVIDTFNFSSFLAFFESASFMVCFILFLIGVSIYTGSLLLLRKITKLLPLNRLLHIKNPTVALLATILFVGICLFSMTLTDLQFIAYCICLGYLFHLIGDMFADSGIPALFPITGLPPISKFWARQRFLPRLLTVKTGSVLESILKIVFLAADIILALVLFCPEFVSSIVQTL